MIKDYHLHPNLLNVPSAADEFISAAVKKDIKEICFTDHMPISVSNAHDRIPRGKVREYCERVRETAKRYEGIISLKCGIEIDYHPSVKDEIDRVLTEGDFDYVLGSSHLHAFIKDFQNYTFNDFASMSIENSTLAAESGLFNTVSHLDMYKFVFINPKRFPLKDDGYDVMRHEAEIKALLDVIAKENVRLEINPHLAEGRPDLSLMYPEETIVKWALDKGCLFAYGSDAHSPSSVGACISELTENETFSRALKTWEDTE